MSAEASLANLLPLWRTIREMDVTALVTPALDYVGGFELSGLDARFAGEAAIAGLGESLRSFVSSLEDEVTLQFLYRVGLDAEPFISMYQDEHPASGNEVLDAYVAGRTQWLRTQQLRSVRLYCFFSRGAGGGLGRGSLGVPLPFSSAKGLAESEHHAKLKALAALRNALRQQFAQLQVHALELGVREMQAVHFQLLNPNHVAARTPVPRLDVRDMLWDEATVRRYGSHLREYTEAEQLLREDVVEESGCLRQERIYRRVMTLKALPEGGTEHLQADRLLRFSLNEGGRPMFFPYWLAVTVSVLNQRASRFKLNTQHGLVDALRNALPWLADRSIAKQTEDAAKENSIQALFAELATLSSKLVSLSATVLVDGESMEQLNARSTAIRSEVSAAGNAELLFEEVSQLPAFLAMMPGSGPYQFRKKTVTSRNAGDYLPLLAPWPGSQHPVSLLTSPGGDVFRFDPFDKMLAPAHHGLVIADTGSGKSVTLGALTIDALAAGADAILVDNGGSWEPMTKLLGGVHLPVRLSTPLTPFLPWGEMLDKEEAGHALDVELIQDVVAFLNICVRDEGEAPFDKMQEMWCARAVRYAYETWFQAVPQERPLMRHFRDAFLKVRETAEHPEDRAICDSLHRRLSPFVGDAMYGPMLDRPSALRFDARLLTFDMAAVSKSPTTRSIAMATVMTAITSRAAQRRAGRTLVEVDEGHVYLGEDATAERFLARSYRVMRKFKVSMWMISQQFSDFSGAKSGPAIIGNSTIKIFLRHGKGGHEPICSYFRFSAKTQEAFANLDFQGGRYSDFLLQYGSHISTVRMALHPLAYWVLTTDGDDKDFILRAAEKNPGLSRLELLKHLAQHYPHGIARASKPVA
jgi:hypothetical protein